MKPLPMATITLKTIVCQTNENKHGTQAYQTFQLRTWNWNYIDWIIVRWVQYLQIV